MPLLEDALKFFGFNQLIQNWRSDDQDQHQNNFRNPIWQNGEDEDDEDVIESRIFSQMTNFMLNNLLSRFFEPRMDDAMKIFIGENFGSQFEESDAFENFPQIEEKPKSSIRDEFLKPNSPFSTETMEPRHPAMLFKSPEDAPQVDSDLDGKINPSQLSKMFTKSDCEPSRRYSNYCKESMNFREFFGNNGKVSERTETLNCNGEVKTTITRKEGGRTYKTILLKDKYGNETKTEEIF